MLQPYYPLSLLSDGRISSFSSLFAKQFARRSSSHDHVYKKLHMRIQIQIYLQILIQIQIALPGIDKVKPSIGIGPQTRHRWSPSPSSTSTSLSSSSLSPMHCNALQCHPCPNCHVRINQSYNHLSQVKKSSWNWTPLWSPPTPLPAVET